jgi:hypothetical protein
MFEVVTGERYDNMVALDSPGMSDAPACHRTNICGNVSFPFAVVIAAIGTSEVQVERMRPRRVDIEHPVAPSAPVLFQI